MDPQAQMMANALMGGANSAMPSQMQQQPDPMQFSAQSLGYGQQGMQGGQGMFSPPNGAQAQMSMQPLNMMGYA
jgi:hypothetical protein